MLLHDCGAPVEVLEHNDSDYDCLQFFCKVCNEVVFNDQELFCVDSLTLLEEAVK